MKLSDFRINLLSMNSDSKEYEFELDNTFFEMMESQDVKTGQVVCKLLVEKLADESFQFRFHTEGIVQVPCDRCLDDMDCPIETDDLLIVKLGTEYSEDDDIVTIPEHEGAIDVSSFIFQFIVLNIPIKHVHAPGKCNTQMLEILNQHLAIRSGDQDNTVGEEVNEEDIDPRWSELLKMKNNI